MEKEELVSLAFEAREQSYSPYSNFCVGAALLCGSGKIYTGCNVENASYGAAICAERGAAMKAASAGERVYNAIAVVGFPRGEDSALSDYPYPCGICRQFLREFAAPDMKAYLARTREDVLETTLSALLPLSFGPENLQKH